MAELQLDRLLETCLRRGSEMLWVVGSPPLVRTDFGLHTLQIPPLTAADVAALIQKIRPADECIHEREGFVEFDLLYGNEWFFRTAIFAQVSPPFVLLIKLPVPPPKQGSH